MVSYIYFRLIDTYVACSLRQLSFMSVVGLVTRLDDTERFYEMLNFEVRLGDPMTTTLPSTQTH